MKSHSNQLGATITKESPFLYKQKLRTSNSYQFYSNRTGNRPSLKKKIEAKD